ncbi:hypothetical protein ACWDYH_17960 [Nocardia goodfellowii]
MADQSFERTGLDYFAEIWGLSPPHDPENMDSYWGFLLTMGSSEGNIYGLWNARDYFLGKDLLLPEVCPERVGSTPQPREPVLLYSAESHYSVAKTARVLLLETPETLGERRYPGECPLGSRWPSAVPVTGGGSGPGSIDIAALRTLAEYFAERRHPVIVVVGAGTTFKGACDDVAAVSETLARCGLSALLANGFDRSELENGTPFPSFDSNVPGVCSMVVSAHKWIGSPWPRGVYLTRNDSQTAAAVGALRLAQFTESRRDNLPNLWVGRSPWSLSLRFRRPAQDVVEEFGLSGMTVPVDGADRHYVHLFIMRDTTREQIDALIARLGVLSSYA